MKKSVIILIMLFSLLMGNISKAQNLGIGPDTFDPDASAGVEMRFTNKGLLIPRLTLSQRNAISSPATSLIIYQTDNTPGYYYNAGTSSSPNWVRLATTGLDGSGVATRVAFWTGTNTLSSNANLYWDNTNSRLGVGTSAPITKFEIYGGHSDTKARLYSTGNGATLDASLDMWASEPNWTYDGSGIGNNVNGSPYYGRRNGNLGQSYIRFCNGDVYIATGSGDATNRVFIQNNGNVGIGTTSPAQKLDVSGGNISTTGQLISTIATGTAPLSVASTTLVTNLNADMLDGHHWSEVPTIPANNVTGSGTTNYVTKWTGTYTQGNSIIYDNGTNVGIGTTSPGSKLEIRGTADLTLRNDQTLSNSGDDLATINLGDAYSGSQARILVERGAAGSGGDNPTDISFWNTPDGSVTLTERMRIMNDGNVGIGTTSPTKKLQVNGTFGVDIDNNSNSPPHTGYVASTDIAFSRDDISGWTTLHSSGVDDAVSSSQSIGFTFNLFGTDYTTFYVSTNGWISFGSAPGSSYTNYALPTSTFSMPVICPYWDDMKTRAAGIRTTLLGELPNRVRIIDFELETYAADYYDVTFQVILHEKSNLISIRYYLVAPDACGQSATIGIQGPGGSVATAVPISCNAKVLDDNYEPHSISFCPVIY